MKPNTTKDRRVQPKEGEKDAFLDVEIFLRLNGRLPEYKNDTLDIDDYKRYCDMVIMGTECPRKRTYKLDGFFDYAWEQYKQLKNFMTTNKTEGKCTCEDTPDTDAYCAIHGQFATPHQPEGGWEKEFDVKFDHFNADYLGTGGSGKQICNSDCSKNYDLEDVKDFIRTLLTTAKEEARREIMEECNKQYEKLQEIKYFKELSYIEKQIFLSGVEELTQAIDQISQSIKKKQNER